MKKIFLFFIAIFAFQSSQASHIAGGELWYEHDTLNDYKVYYRFYRACEGIGAPQVVTIGYRSASLNVTSSDTASSITPSVVINNSCTTTTCTSLLSPFPGYEVYEYELSLTLPPASDWVISSGLSARSIANNTNSGGTMYVEATLDNLNVPFNNSAFPYTYVNMLQNAFASSNFLLPTIDIDGDSLDFQFTNPLNGFVNQTPTNLVFQQNYSATNPFNSSPAPVMDNLTGSIALSPAPLGSCAFAVKIDEYRNGVKIASTIRDYLFFLAALNNQPPTLSGVNNTTSYTTSVNVCPNSSLNFTINSADADITDSTKISSLFIPTGATFSTNAAQNEVGTFNWTPTAADVRSQPYIVSFKVSDNNCYEQSYGYQIFVNQCNTDSVWAGDANADFTCDNYDILNIGIANSVTGPVRAGATTNWQAEWCANWTNNFVSNINQKHADCNGDGVVNATDLASVTANYGLVHSKTSQVGQYKTAGLPDLYCDVTNVQAHKGSTVNIPVMLGTSGSEMNDFYGISATVELLNAQTSAPISISKNTSWIGNASNSFSFEKSLAPNKTAFTFVRNNQTNLMAQQGQIGEITFPIDMASVNGSEVTVQFSDIKMIKNNGEEINDYNVLADKLTILAPVAVSDIEKGFTVNVYPNPAKSNMTISLQVDKSQHYQIALYDVVGRLVEDNVYDGLLDIGKHDINLDMSNKALGQYQLELTTESGKVVLPVQKR